MQANGTTRAAFALAFAACAALLGYATYRIGQSVGAALARSLSFLDGLEPADRI